ncbi:hypothetical protein M3231_06780 [Neobacillus mesonae]|nr:hypothetical protein [Neobacillus mesonae]
MNPLGWSVSIVLLIILASSTVNELPNHQLEPDIRAIGQHTDGRLVVRENEDVKSSLMGAPSCYGLETDTKWTGNFEVVWEPDQGAPDTVLEIHDNFDGDGMIQQTTEAVRMEKFKVGDTELFAFTPRYRDCHALPTYFFTVSEGEAVSVPVVFNSEHKAIPVYRFPDDYGVTVQDGELLISEGYGAGQDFIHMYHFSYDATARELQLKKTTPLEYHEFKSYFEDKAREH